MNSVLNSQKWLMSPACDTPLGSPHVF